MKFRYFVFIIAAFVVTSLLFVGSSSADMSPTSIMLADSSSSALATTTTVMDSSGDYTVSSAELDTTASTATIGSDGYLCGNVQYHATQRWYDPFGIIVWTYRSTFGVHVCHNSVRYVTALYDEAMDSTLGWTWCGNIVRWHSSLPYSSGRSYTKGCFDVASKILDARYPWAKMTIGGNGGLWARSTGVG